MALRRPLDLERFRCAHRIPFLIRDHGEKIVLAYHAHAGNVFDRTLVHRHQRAACIQRAHHTCMHHAIDLDVGDELLPTHDFFGDDGLRKRLADDFVFRRFFRFGRAFNRQRIAVLLVPFEFVMEILAADQFAIGHALRARHHHAVLYLELRRRHTEFLRRALHQHAACFRRGIAQRDTAALEPGAAGRAALIAGQRRVAHDDVDALEREIEFFGHHLLHGDIDALAHVHLAEVGGGVAVGQYRDPRVELVGQQGWLACGNGWFAGGSLRQRRFNRAGQGDADNQRTRGFEEIAAGKLIRIHGYLLTRSWFVKRA